MRLQVRADEALCESKMEARVTVVYPPRALLWLGVLDHRLGAMGEVVYAMEIEPMFVGITVSRWERFSGGHALRE